MDLGSQAQRPRGMLVFFKICNLLLTCEGGDEKSHVHYGLLFLICFPGWNEEELSWPLNSDSNPAAPSPLHELFSGSFLCAYSPPEFISWVLLVGILFSPAPLCM